MTEPTALSQIDPQFIVNRQGRDFVLYVGLLDAAHRTKRLEGIHTEVIQFPAEANGWTTFVHASVFLGGARFDGTGEANAENVGKTIAVHAPRMAETRAKARALRDALNIQGVAIEELGDENDVPPAAAPQRQAPPARQQAKPLKPHATQVAPSPATLQRISRLWSLLGNPGEPSPVRDQTDAEALVALLHHQAEQKPANEEQWSKYLSAAAKLTAAGVPDAEVQVADTMTVLEYEQMIVKMNELKKRLQPAAGSAAR